MSIKENVKTLNLLWGISALNLWRLCNQDDRQTFRKLQIKVMFSRQSRMVIVNIIYSKTQADPQSCVYEASNWNWQKKSVEPCSRCLVWSIFFVIDVIHARLWKRKAVVQSTWWYTSNHSTNHKGSLEVRQFRHW